MNKAEARQFFLQKRSALSPDEILQLSKSITNNLFEHFDFNAFQIVHLFLPITNRKEVDTFFIINQLQTQYPSLKIAVPVADFENGTLKHVVTSFSTPLSLNRWGIPEPAQGQEIHESEIDMVLVPLLAFDIAGHRVGYGKGFYDRFLSRCRKQTIKAGLSFFEPIQKISDANSLDIALDLCVTPSGIIGF